MLNKSFSHGRRLICAALALALALLCALPASAAGAEGEAAADRLYNLGLFKGTGTDAAGEPVYDLDRALTRSEAVTMLVRLMGREQEALGGSWQTPFTDVAAWARPYVGYAYTHGLTRGTSDTLFGGEDPVTAAQYITFVLRALGYDDAAGDFAWDSAWELSDELGLTDGEYGAENSAQFLRADVALISADALDMQLKGSERTLLESIPLPGEAEDADDYTVDMSGAIPEELGGRRLSAGELAALSGLTPERAAESIETLADAYAWLAQEGYSTTGMSGSPQYGLANGTAGRELSWVEMSTVINTLVEGDYDEEGTLLLVSQTDEQGWDMFYISFNYVKSGGVYYITDPLDHLESSGMPAFRIHTVRAGSLGAVRAALAEVNGSASALATVAAYPLFTGRIEVEFSAEPFSATFPNIPGVEYVYLADSEAAEDYREELEQAAEQEAARWAQHARGLKIADYGMPQAIGQTTLSYDGALALVGQDPQRIADSVKTVGDVLQYMIAARFGYDAPGAYTPWYGRGGEIWGFDAPGDVQLEQNYGCCCGGYANAVSYLLRGDYEKVGTLRWIGGGNHTISWVYTGGKYYVFDFTQYCNGGNYNFYGSRVAVLDRLEDFYDNMPSTYDKSEIVLMVAFEAGEAMYPSNWNDPPEFTGLTFPAEAEGEIRVIYQRDAAKGVNYRELDISIPGWNS